MNFADALFPDRLTVTLLLLTGFLFLIVFRYAVRYMQGEPGKGRFTLRLSITGSCVFAIILAQNLLLFALAWCATSLSLHHLLQFYQDRPGAVLAARKKFLISRLGDICLLAVLILTRSEFGTWDFHQMFAAAARPERHLDAICILLVFAALLKSAQFPFHTWLPDTMETPTPVSALMHAGIINAGGILVIRLSPLICHSRVALLILTVTGAFTALFASVVMTTQASVKRCLAFSTVGQMGFMMLECGLGAFQLALLHLVAHSLYKAYAFLSSGSVVMGPTRSVAPAVRPLWVVVSLVCAVVFTVVAAPSDHRLLTGIFCLAAAQLLWTYGMSLGMLLGAAAGSVYFAMERAASGVVAPLRSDQLWLTVPIMGLFVLVSLIQSQLPKFSQTRLGKHLYVHARNGFYLNTIANRITAAVWPLQAKIRETY